MTIWDDHYNRKPRRRTVAARYGIVLQGDDYVVVDTKSGLTVGRFCSHAEAIRVRDNANRLSR